LGAAGNGLQIDFVWDDAHPDALSHIGRVAAMAGSFSVAASAKPTETNIENTF
jgi:hypothetical protein